MQFLMGIVGSETGAVPLLGAYKPPKWRTDQLWPEVGPRQVLGPHGGVYEPVCHSRDMYTTEHKRTCSAVVEVPNSTHSTNNARLRQRRSPSRLRPLGPLGCSISHHRWTLQLILVFCKILLFFKHPTLQRRQDGSAVVMAGSPLKVIHLVRSTCHAISGQGLANYDQPRLLSSQPQVLMLKGASGHFWICGQRNSPFRHTHACVKLESEPVLSLPTTEP